MRERPLSPHLSVYRFMYTMTLSVLHRATGIALSVGLLLLAWWLMAAASGPEAYDRASIYLSSVPVKVLLVGWLLSFAYHLCNGLRHLSWDIGIGMERHQARLSAKLVLIAAAVLALAIAWLAFGGAA